MILSELQVHTNIMERTYWLVDNSQLSNNFKNDTFLQSNIVRFWRNLTYHVIYVSHMIYNIIDVFLKYIKSEAFFQECIISLLTLT